ncbi:polyphosphate kinase 2 family protein [Glaciihabitans sp. INWT7]|uniref:polyphosphate kinase 2 family protein n=1 Tax=Glaciihabitans sp. INWT7 TaxID=2596912 RepID=UPI001624776D|nr:polyphosphate kinase 2 family protein [Glaciihabitans sp. INWT7]QNE45712.1 polyphosphate kinase 2 family protein [Glaciihabitans sp. INWT7]
MAKTVWTEDPGALLKVGAGFSLAGVDPSSTPGMDGGKSAGKALLEKGRAELGDLQERLWAESRYGGTRSVLLVLQAMDTAGKGGIVQHVVGGVDPQGVTIYGFKKPTKEELSHDFLWRVRNQLPTAGHLGVFDRSHYEDVLIARVRNLAEPAVIEERYGLINEFEKQVVDSGTTMVKVMLHISADEQKDRLEARLDDPEKNWKFNPGDLDERALWPQYQEAYQIAFEKTSTADVPWFVIPADHKWYARVAVQHLLLDALRGLHLTWPPAEFDVAEQKARLADEQSPVE